VEKTFQGAIWSSYGSQTKKKPMARKKQTSHDKEKKAPLGQDESNSQTASSATLLCTTTQSQRSKEMELEMMHASSNPNIDAPKWGAIQPQLPLGKRCDQGESENVELHLLQERSQPLQGQPSSKRSRKLLISRSEPIADQQTKNMLNTPIKLLTERQLAEFLAVSPRTARRLRTQKILPFYKLGRGIIRFDQALCLKALDNYRIEPRS